MQLGLSVLSRRGRFAAPESNQPRLPDNIFVSAWRHRSRPGENAGPAASGFSVSRGSYDSQMHFFHFSLPRYLPARKAASRIKHYSIASVNHRIASKL